MVDHVRTKSGGDLTPGKARWRGSPGSAAILVFLSHGIRIARVDCSRLSRAYSRICSWRTDSSLMGHFGPTALRPAGVASAVCGQAHGDIVAYGCAVNRCIRGWPGARNHDLAQCDRRHGGRTRPLGPGATAPGSATSTARGRRFGTRSHRGRRSMGVPAQRMLLRHGHRPAP